MSDDLIFYTNPMSRGRIARWMLEEVDQPYQTEVIAFGPAMKSPEYAAINPMGKVPALRHGDTVVTEVAAICAYLADAFPGAGLAPAPGERARGPYYRWLFFTAGPIEAAVTDTTFGLEVPDDRRGMVGYGSMSAVLSTLETVLADRQYVAGDRFTAADLYLAAHLGWGMQFGTIERRPAFERYAGPHLARPAKARADGIDNALVAPGS